MKLDFSNLRILVIGDFIFDRYTYVKVKGLASKNNIISSVYEKSENYIGGAGAVYMHLSDFVSKNLKLVSLANLNDLQSFTLLRFLPPKLYDDFCLIIDPDVFMVKDPAHILESYLLL